MRQIDLLDNNKCSSGNIPTSTLKATREIVCPFLTDCINNAIYDCKFPDDLSPLFKNDDSTFKGNFRPISVLPAVSKIYERILKEQISSYFYDKLSKLLCGFREGFSTQHALIRLIEKWRQCLDASGIVETILMDLSKAYDCLPHDLLIAKLEAYGLDVNSLRLMYSYLDSRLQRVKIHLFKIRGAKTEVFCCLRFRIFEAKILFCVQSLAWKQIFTFISVFVWKLR